MFEGLRIGPSAAEYKHIFIYIGYESRLYYQNAADKGENITEPSFQRQYYKNALNGSYYYYCTINYTYL